MPVHFLGGHADYSDYTQCTEVTETAVQGATLTESYGNFGLKTPVTCTSPKAAATTPPLPRPSGSTASVKGLPEINP